MAKGASKSPDFATIGGALVAAVGIIGGLLLEGGRIRDISQITAAIIVLGGTLGAVMIHTPMSTLRGAARQDSGYRHEVTHNVSALSVHPVTTGLPASFPLTDELYLYEVFERDVIPLLQSDHDFTAANFYSAAKVVREGKMFNNEGWQHEPGSRLIGWVKRHRNSPIVYLQCGDGPDTYKNEHFRVLLRSAILWAASPEARAWARARV